MFFLIFLLGTGLQSGGSILLPAPPTLGQASGGLMKLIDISTPKYPNTFTMVDDEDYDFLNQWKWGSVIKSSGKIYAGRGFLREEKQTKNTLRMHQAILATKDGFEIDHIDGNGLNNQKSNLRYATHQQNLWNVKKIKKNSLSKYLGVSQSRYLYNGKWLCYYVAKITVKKKPKYLGCSKNEIEMAKLRDFHAKKEYGEFAVLNFP